jgi:hypothetical protein
VATAPNLGTGGSVLDAQFGSSSTSNTNEPLALAHTDTNYLYLPGVSGNYASIPDSAALDITGDIDIRVRVALDDWTPSTGNTLVNKANGAANDFAYYLEVGSTGALRFRYSADGTTRLDRLSTASVPFADGSIGWVRVTLDVDNGAGSNVVSFFTAADSSTMPSSWTALGTAVTTAGTTSIFASGQPLQLGGQNSGLAVNLSGKLYYVQILNGIGGTVVLDADFTTGITSGGQTSFVESSSNAATVTINRSTSGRKAVAVVRPVWLLGTDDYFEVADNDLLDFTNTEDLSAVAIVRAWGTTADDTLIAKKAGTTSASAGWMLDMGTSSVTQARISDGTTQHAPTAGTRTAGALSLLAAVKSGSTITSYLGSTAGTPVTITATGTYANSEVMRIGRLSGAGTSYADVELLAAMVFRRALSATELAAIATYYGV